MWARYNETNLCHLKKAAVPFLASQSSSWVIVSSCDKRLRNKYKQKNDSQTQWDLDGGKNMHGEKNAINLKSAAQKTCLVWVIKGRKVRAKQNLHCSINVANYGFTGKKKHFPLCILVLQRGYCFNYMQSTFSLLKSALRASRQANKNSKNPKYFSSLGSLPN